MTSQLDCLAPIIVDNFAGGGGASTGIELATGRVVDLAINHDRDAILMHRTNHPYTRHMQTDVWDVDPVRECGGRPVALAWFSPDCKHFSKAKGAALVDRKIRGLAWIVLRWAGTVRPQVIIIENVEEFQTWGPVRKGKPIKAKAGQTFLKWKRQLSDLGYHIEHRELVAADYGAPTTRKRFVLIARCDGKPIVWPEPTHAPADDQRVKRGELLPWRAAAEIIDWTLPSYSIFDSKAEIKARYGVNAVRPLADNTMRRIIRGVDKFTIKSGKPFLVPTGYGERAGQAPRVHDIDDPLPTVVSSGKHNLCQPLLAPLTVRHALVSAQLVKYYSTGRALSVADPLHTATTHDREALALAHIAEFKGQDVGQPMTAPLRTITTSAGTFGEVRTMCARYAGGADLWRWPQVRALLNRHCGYDLADDEVLLLKIGGGLYFIADLLLRMLSPRELYNAMGFPPDYIIDRDYMGNEYGKSKQVARCGNAVCPQMATALVRANCADICGSRALRTMAEFSAAVQRAYDTAYELLTGEHSDLYGAGYIWQAEFPQGTDGIYCCGTYFGR